MAVAAIVGTGFGVVRGKKHGNMVTCKRFLLGDTAIVMVTIFCAMTVARYKFSESIAMEILIVGIARLIAEPEQFL